MKIEWCEALKRVTKSNTENTVFVTTFHPNMPSIAKIIKKHHKVMCDESSRLKRCFPKPSMIAYRRSKNLRDLLIRAKVPPQRNQRRILNGFRNCGELCHMCPFTPDSTTKSHISYITKQNYTINSPMNCKSNGVVYKMMCKKCPKFVYIGETGKAIKQRFSGHKTDAKQEVINKPCGKHFNMKGHSYTRDMTIVGIEQVFPKNDDMLRKTRESMWIN